MLKYHYKEIAIVIVGVLALYGLSFIIPNTAGKSEPQASNLPTGEISVRGTIVCLPHRDTSGPQTLECAYGLLDKEGRYYGLHDTDPNYGNISGTPMNVEVDVYGTFTPRQDAKYASIGVIDVVTITVVDVPKRVSLTGTYVCLPHTDTTGPQTEECAFGLRIEDGTYYAIDFALMSQTAPSLKAGDVISANGVLVPVEQLSTNYWQRYPIKGIFVVTDSVVKK